jgi:hypothetical protein
MGGKKIMTRNLIATCIVSIAFTGVGFAQATESSARTDAHYTQAELKQLALNAHEPAQYTALASYFGKQRDNYLQKAAEKKKEWLELSQGVTSAASKYPLPADSMRNYYEYYMHKAAEAGTLEVKYTQMMAQGAPVSAE